MTEQMLEAIHTWLGVAPKATMYGMQLPCSQHIGAVASGVAEALGSLTHQL